MLAGSGGPGQILGNVEVADDQSWLVTRGWMEEAAEDGGMIDKAHDEGEQT